MGEKGKMLQIAIGNTAVKAPIPMKLFAIGDVDRSPSFSTSRICSVKFVHLTIVKVLEEELTSVTIAVKMQGSKRTLRSAEFELSSSGLFDADLDISVSIQYPHYLKRRENMLFVMLQRRKRYKTRRILGYKTLAIGTLDMNEVLQRAVDLELHLYADVKDKNSSVANITMASLSTQPANAGNEATSEDDEFTSDMSDSEGDAVGEDPIGLVESSKTSQKPGRTHRQGNFKQKVISLLRKFKTPEGFDADAVDLEVHDKGGLMDEDLLDELDFDSDSAPEFFDNISLQSTPRPHLSPYFKPGRSLTTLPVPGANERNIEKVDEASRNNSDSHPDALTDDDAGGLRPEEAGPEQKRKSKGVLREKSFTPRDSREKEAKEKLERKAAEREKEMGQQRDLVLKVETRKCSQTIPVEASPRKVLLEQLDTVFPSPDEELPSFLTWVNGNHHLGKALQEHLQNYFPPAVCACTTADLKACFTLIANRIQKLSHTARHNTIIKVILCGGDEFVNAVLRSYVELFSDKPPDLQNHIKFIFIPLGESTLAVSTATVDSYAAALFDENNWHAMMAKTGTDYDWESIVSKIHKYVHSATYPLNLLIAQAMINFKSQGMLDAESSQMFIPFLSHVRVHSLSGDWGPISGIESDELHPVNQLQPTPVNQGSPSSAVLSLPANELPKDFSPPNSPVVQSHSLPSATGSSVQSSSDARELQLDYWMSSSGVLSADEKDKDREKERKKSDISKPKDTASAKTSLKATFKFLYVIRPVQPVNAFTLMYATKEKKIQIMRALGKKTKDAEVRPVVVEGMNRLICRICKANSTGMRVVIDGCDWSNINFFQLSPQWHSAVKCFPLLIHQED